MKLRKCASCGAYTMKKSCPNGHETFFLKPPKYSPEDNYGAYRRKVKKPMLQEKGLI